MFGLFGFIILGFILITWRDKDGFNLFGQDKEGYNKKGYDSLGFNREGFNSFGRNKDGFDRNGFDKDGFDVKGFNKNGFDRKGYDVSGYNKEGYDKNGFNKFGYSKTGFDAYGFNTKGFNVEGFDKLGFDKDGYSKLGYDSNGYNKSGFDKNGYNKHGFNIDGVNKDNIPWWFYNYSFLKITPEYFLNQKYPPVLQFKWKLFDQKVIKSNKTYKNDVVGSQSLNITLFNPFNILGLTKKASEKDILRRSNELIKLITINAEITLPQVLFIDKINFDQTLLKNAQIKLLDIKEKLKFYFFWFNDGSLDLTNVFENVPSEELIERLLKKAYEKVSIFELKNAILFTSIYSIIHKFSNPIITMMPFWKSIIENTTFWNSFSKEFTETIDSNQKSKFVDEFKANIVQELSDYYYHLYSLIGDSKIISGFYKIFKVHSKESITKILNPEIIQFNSKLEELFDLKLSFNNKTVTNTSKSKIRLIESLIQSFSSKIESFNFSQLSETKEVLNKVSTKLRSLAIDLLNGVEFNGDDFYYGKQILNKASDLTSSDVMKNKIKNDFADIESEGKKKKMLDLLKNDFEQNNYERARKRIQEIEDSDSSYQNLEFCRSLKLISYKNEYNHKLNKALEAVNTLVNNARYASDIYSTKRAVRSYLNEAVEYIDTLILVAEKANEPSEKEDLQRLKYKIFGQIREF